MQNSMAEITIKAPSAEIAAIVAKIRAVLPGLAKNPQVTEIRRGKVEITILTYEIT